MMKEICASACNRRWIRSPANAYYVFSCFNQDQPLDRVDFAGLPRDSRELVTGKADGAMDSTVA